MIHETENNKKPRKRNRKHDTHHFTTRPFGQYEDTSKVDDKDNIGVDEMIAQCFNEKKFNLVVKGISYHVRTIPFSLHDQVLYRVVINGSTDHLVVKDSKTGSFTGIDNESSTLTLSPGMKQALQQILSEL